MVAKQTCVLKKPMPRTLKLSKNKEPERVAPVACSTATSAGSWLLTHIDIRLFRLLLVPSGDEPAEHPEQT